MRLKHIIQDIIDNEKMRVDGFMINKDHMVFTKPPHEYEKGETSKKKNEDAKINYTYTDNDNVTHMLQPIEEILHMV